MQKDNPESNNSEYEHKVRIFILHPGKAAYPEIAAYRDYFASEFEVLDGTLADYEVLSNKEETILWCIMGFYPSKLVSKAVIHDYRSLSVGRFSKLKDKVKKAKNAKPDIRIFQNDLIKKSMGFNDDIPYTYLPMGVPEWIYSLQADPNYPKATFCYIGEITKERGMDKVIEAFIKNRNSSDSFILVGPPEKEILSKYKDSEGIILTGKVTQKEALIIVKNSDYCICRIPKKYPYDLQMPTKFMEYAAAQKIVICNDSPSNRLAMHYLSYPAIISGSEIFTKQLYEQLTKKTEQISLERDIRWDNAIKSSEIERFITKCR